MVPKVLLLLFPTFGGFEVAVAAAVLRETHELTTVALDVDAVTGEAGFRCLPHLAADAVDPAAYEALLVPGGDTVHLRDAAPLFALTRAPHARGALLAAMGAGPYVLERAGLLAGRPYTVGYARANRGVLGRFDETRFRPEPMVESDRILTAQGHAYAAFGLRVGELLGTDVDADVAGYYRGLRNPWLGA